MDEKDTQKRKQCEDRGRVWRDMAASQGMPRNGTQPPEAKRGKESILSESLWRECILVITLILLYGLQNCERISVCCLKPPHLW